MHPNVVAILRHFEFEHLPEPQREISQRFHALAYELAKGLEGPELIAGLRKLLEAKDCAVRASLADVPPAVAVDWQKQKDARTEFRGKLSEEIANATRIRKS
jgi:hypothetical protein